jgi:transcriptional regulator with XRE-family HTH domain
MYKVTTNTNIEYYQTYVAPKLRLLAKINNLTIIDISKMVYFERKAVSNWFNGYVVPNVMIFQQLCEIFNVSIETMLSPEPLSIDYGNKDDCPKCSQPDERKIWLIKHHRCTSCGIKLPYDYINKACCSCKRNYYW